MRLGFLKLVEFYTALTKPTLEFSVARTVSDLPIFRKIMTNLTKDKNGTLQVVNRTISGYTQSYNSMQALNNL